MNHQLPRSSVSLGAAPRPSLRCALLLFTLVASSTLLAAPPAIPPAARKVVIDGQELPAVGFNLLSGFEYLIVDAGTGATPEQIEEARKRDQVPAWVRAYQDKRVMLTGYMLPLQMENGLARKFILMRDVNTCCYGATPNMNDYVIVTMASGGVKAVQDVPVDLIGQLRIAEKYENGYVVALYEMTGEKYLGPKK